MEKKQTTHPIWKTRTTQKLTYLPTPRQSIMQGSLHRIFAFRFFFPSLFGMQTVCPPETWGWLIWARWDSDGARKWEWEWEWEWAGTGHGYGWIL